MIVVSAISSAISSGAEGLMGWVALSICCSRYVGSGLVLDGWSNSVIDRVGRQLPC